MSVGHMEHFDALAQLDGPASFDEAVVATVKIEDLCRPFLCVQLLHKDGRFLDVFQIDLRLRSGGFQSPFVVRLSLYGQPVPSGEVLKAHSGSEKPEQRQFFQAVDPL